MFRQTTEKPKTPLCELLYKYGSDKCPQIFHSYSEYYYDILKNYKDDFTQILEIGIGTNEIMKPIVGETYQIGSSLRAWRDFFINATIYGLDINTEVFFDDDRILCLYTDQSRSDVLESTITKIKEINKNPDLTFDLIIDDGSHLVNHMILSFNTLFKYIKPGGIYIIEDIKKIDIHIFERMNLQNGQIIMSFPGNTDWDGFIAIKKIK